MSEDESLSTSGSLESLDNSSLGCSSDGTSTSSDVSSTVSTTSTSTLLSSELASDSSSSSSSSSSCPVVTASTSTSSDSNTTLSSSSLSFSSLQGFTSSASSSDSVTTSTVEVSSISTSSGSPSTLIYIYASSYNSPATGAVASPLGPSSSSPPPTAVLSEAPLSSTPTSARGQRIGAHTGDVFIAGSTTTTAGVRTTQASPPNDDSNGLSSAQTRSPSSGSSQTTPAMAAAPVPTMFSLPHEAELTTATWEMTMPTASGTMTAGQVVQMTAVSTVGLGSSALPSSTSISNSEAISGSKHILLAAILTPIVIFCVVVLPCLWFLFRLRTRKKVRFMATYEDMTGDIPSYRYIPRAPYAETLSTINEYDSQWDMVSIPSARGVHTDMLPVGTRSDLEGSSNPFADPSDDDNAHSPLVGRGFPRWYGRTRSETRATSPGSESSASMVASVAAPSRWGALSPSSVSSRSTSRLGSFSPVPLDSSTASKGSQLRLGVYSSRSSGQEQYSSDGGGVYSGSDFERMEDPFANPNKRSSKTPLPLLGGGLQRSSQAVDGSSTSSTKPGVVYSSLLPKVSRADRH
ncbi:hypothetical protein BC835DRAFT_1414163 [Cytidiella melzeri]|nr:hypothetical protein BC835DRAFT_1414163 [Cytidiella melzeri]